MKVKELIVKLQECGYDDEVVIPVVLESISVGCTPHVQVETIQKGFDWDSGKVFLSARGSDHITTMSKEEYKSLIQYKQLVTGVRGKEELSSLSSKFVKKDFVLQRLMELFYCVGEGSFKDSDLENLISDIQKEKI